MKSTEISIKNIDDYLAQLPDNQRIVLEELRQIVINGIYWNFIGFHSIAFNILSLHSITQHNNTAFKAFRFYQLEIEFVF